MKLLKITLFIFISVCSMHAQKMVVDARCIEQVGKNTTAAIGLEASIKNRFDKIKGTEVHNLAIIEGLHLHLKKIEDSNQSVSDFQKESEQLKLLYHKITRLYSAISDATHYIVKYPKGVIGSYKTLIMDAEIIFTQGFSNTIQLLSNPKQMMSPEQRLWILDNFIIEVDQLINRLNKITYIILSNNDMTSIIKSLSPKVYDTYQKSQLTKYMAETTYYDIKNLINR